MKRDISSPACTFLPQLLYILKREKENGPIRKIFHHLLASFCFNCCAFRLQLPLLLLLALLLLHSCTHLKVCIINNNSHLSQTLDTSWINSHCSFSTVVHTWKSLFNVIQVDPCQDITWIYLHCSLSTVHVVSHSTQHHAKTKVYPESQKPGRRVGIADRKVFARPESFCAYLRSYP